MISECGNPNDGQDENQLNHLPPFRIFILRGHEMVCNMIHESNTWRNLQPSVLRITNHHKLAYTEFS
ncbi:hypothetical protein PISMIDRAFT_678873 [Pisolithus microcarpus 441]|uniref:Uncharacterized protein n=1 Tax=Pisolithus microcarpus 441 TaxID=765257 RepID=A0A0C9YG22_9AGAM|nr:hypothetical protein PISMIDRAFT_678873 [Pisolithus microcarpus 441]